MIQTKAELREYLEQDRIALYRTGRKRPKLFGDEIWKWQIVYRKYEFYSNTAPHSAAAKILRRIYQLRYHRASVRLGFSIPINVFGPGLSIAHYGSIVVNKNARVGKNCRIQENVTIGATSGQNEAPVMGDNIFLGSGARVIGDIRIGSDTAVGANAVVVRSFPEGGVTLGGVPARVISGNSSRSNLNRELFDK